MLQTGRPNAPFPPKEAVCFSAADPTAPWNVGSCIQGPPYPRLPLWTEGRGPDLGGPGQECWHHDAALRLCAEAESQLDSNSEEIVFTLF